MIYSPTEGLSNSLLSTYLYSFPQLCGELFQNEMNCDKLTQLESGHKSFAFFNSRISIYIYTQGILQTTLVEMLIKYLSILLLLFIFLEMKSKHLIVRIRGRSAAV